MEDDCRFYHGLELSSHYLFFCIALDCCPFLSQHFIVSYLSTCPFQLNDKNCSYLWSCSYFCYYELNCLFLLKLFFQQHIFDQLDKAHLGSFALCLLFFYPLSFWLSLQFACICCWYLPYKLSLCRDWNCFNVFLSHPSLFQTTGCSLFDECSQQSCYDSFLLVLSQKCCLKLECLNDFLRLIEFMISVQHVD